MGTSIKQLLPANVYQAAVNANSPSAANPFATMADIGASDEWSEVLGNGNTTGGNHTIWSRGDQLQSEGISNLLATVVGPVGAGPAEDQTTLTGITYSVNGDRLATIKLGATITITGTANNDGVHVITAAESIGLGPYKTFFQFAGIAADVAGGTVQTDAGALQINFNNPDFYAPNEALDGYMWESNDGIGSSGRAWREFNPRYHQLGYGEAYHYMVDGGTNNSSFTIYGANFSFTRPYYSFNIYGENSISLSIGNTLFTKAGNFIVQENDTAGYTTGNVPNYPGAFIAQGTTINQNVVNAVALGTNGAIVKTNDSAYVNAVAFNAGLAGEMRLVHTPNASDFTATLQAATGTIAYLSDIPAGGGGLSAVLTAGNTTNNGQTIDALNGGGQLDLRQGSDNTVVLSNDAGAVGAEGVYLSDGYFATYGAGYNAVYEGGLISGSDYYLSSYTGKFNINITDNPTNLLFGGTGILIGDTNGHTLTQGVPSGGAKIAVIIGGTGGGIANGVANSVKLGGGGFSITDDNTAGAVNFSIHNSGNRVLLSGALLSTDVAQTFQAEDGVIAVGPAWDTLIANPTATEDGYVIAWNNTNNEYELVPDAIGSTPTLSAVLTAGDTGTAGQNINLVGNAGAGGYIDIANGAGGAGPTCLDASLRIQSINTGASDGETNIETTTCRPSLRHNLNLHATTIGSYVTLQSASTGDGLFKVLGNGEATVQFNLSGTDRTIQFQDASGTVAFTGEYDTGATYTPTNVSTDRSFDANSTTLNELADIVGTLINDLQGVNILS